MHKFFSNLEFEFVPSTTHMHLCPIRDPPTITLAHKTIFKKKHRMNKEWKQHKVKTKIKSVGL